jgi:hypothetical protein
MSLSASHICDRVSPTWAATGVAINHFFEIAMPFRDSHIFSGDWQIACSALLGSADRAAWLHRIDSAALIYARQRFSPGAIVATDTTFSSNRFAWAHQVHKLDCRSN